MCSVTIQVSLVPASVLPTKVHWEARGVAWWWSTCQRTLESRIGHPTWPNKPTNRPKWEVREAICGKPGMFPLCLQNMGLVTALVIARCTAGILLGLPSKNPCTKCLGDPTPIALSEEDNVGQKRKKTETSTPLLLPSLPCCSTTQLAYILCL